MASFPESAEFPPIAGVRDAGDPGGRWGSSTVLALAWAIAVAVGVLDYASGTEFDVSLVYVFPVAWATWRTSRRAGASLALLCAVLDTVLDVHEGRYRPALLTLGWNVAVQSALLLVAVEGVHRLRLSVMSGRSLATGLSEAYQRLDDEVRLVAEVQTSLLPAHTPRIDGYRVAVHYAMCTRAGGDYYDFLPASDGRHGILVADVSGHGPSAAVIMAMARVIVHDERDVLAEPERLLELANRRLVENSVLGHFVTACCAVLEPASGAVEYALAGHPPPMHASAATGAVVELGTPDGPPLAVEAEVRYRRQAARLEPGDVLLAYTDGLTEARDPDGACFGEERVRLALEGARGLGAEAVVAGLLGGMKAHLQGLPAQDDVTILVVERLAPRARG